MTRMLTSFRSIEDLHSAMTQPLQEVLNLGDDLGRLLGLCPMFIINATGYKVMSLIKRGVIYMITKKGEEKEQENYNVLSMTKKMQADFIKEYMETLEVSSPMHFLFFIGVAYMNGYGEDFEELMVEQHNVTVEELLQRIPTRVGNNQYDWDSHSVMRKIEMPWLKGKYPDVGLLYAIDCSPLDTVTSSFSFITSLSETRESLLKNCIGMNVSLIIQLYRTMDLVMTKTITDGIIRAIVNDPHIDVNIHHLMIMGGVWNTSGMTAKETADEVKKLLRKQSHPVLAMYLSSLSDKNHILLDYDIRVSSINVIGILVEMLEEVKGDEIKTREIFKMIGGIVLHPFVRVHPRASAFIDNIGKYMYINDEQEPTADETVQIYMKRALLNKRKDVKNFTQTINVPRLSFTNDDERTVFLKFDPDNLPVRMRGSIYIFFKDGRVVPGAFRQAQTLTITIPKYKELFKDKTIEMMIKENFQAFVDVFPEAFRSLFVIDDQTLFTDEFYTDKLLPSAATGMYICSVHPIRKLLKFKHNDEEVEEYIGRYEPIALTSPDTLEETWDRMLSQYWSDLRDVLYPIATTGSRDKKNKLPRELAKLAMQANIGELDRQLIKLKNDKIAMERKSKKPFSPKSGKQAEFPEPEHSVSVDDLGESDTDEDEETKRRRRDEKRKAKMEKSKAKKTGSSPHTPQSPNKTEIERQIEVVQIKLDVAKVDLEKLEIAQGIIYQRIINFLCPNDVVAVRRPLSGVQAAPAALARNDTLYDRYCRLLNQWNIDPTIPPRYIRDLTTVTQELYHVPSYETMVREGFVRYFSDLPATPLLPAINIGLNTKLSIVNANGSPTFVMRNMGGLVEENDIRVLAMLEVFDEKFVKDILGGRVDNSLRHFTNCYALFHHMTKDVNSLNTRRKKRKPRNFLATSSDSSDDETTDNTNITNDQIVIVNYVLFTSYASKLSVEQLYRKLTEE
jgi:hypothetical protein